MYVCPAMVLDFPAWVDRPAMNWGSVSPKCHQLRSNLQCDGIWGGTFERWFGLQGRALLCGINAFFLKKGTWLSYKCLVVWDVCKIYLHLIEKISSSVQLLSVSDSLRPHESQHARPPCPSPTPRVHSNSRPSSQWCHPAISSSGIPFSSCPQFLPASESFPMSQLFAWGGQSTGVWPQHDSLQRKPRADLL